MRVLAQGPGEVIDHLKRCVRKDERRARRVAKGADAVGEAAYLRDAPTQRVRRGQARECPANPTTSVLLPSSVPATLWKSSTPKRSFVHLGRREDARIRNHGLLGVRHYGAAVQIECPATASSRRSNYSGRTSWISRFPRNRSRCVNWSLFVGSLVDGLEVVAEAAVVLMFGSGRYCSSFNETGLMPAGGDDIAGERRSASDAVDERLSGRIVELVAGSSDGEVARRAWQAVGTV